MVTPHDVRIVEKNETALRCRPNTMSNEFLWIEFARIITANKVAPCCFYE